MPHRLTETKRYAERYIVTDCIPPTRSTLTENLPDFIVEGVKKCRPNPEWDTCYDPVSEIQVLN
jgi:hypothetical protein